MKWAAPDAENHFDENDHWFESAHGRRHTYSGKSIIDSGKEIPEIQRSLGIMYQSGALFGSLTVLENVRFPLDQFSKLPLEARNLTAQMLLNAMEMPGSANLTPGELSGGLIKKSWHCESTFSRSDNSPLRRTKRRT